MTTRRVGARGFSALAALMVTAGITAMVMAGLAARVDDLGREDAALCRLEARLAAESAIAVAEAHLARGQRTVTARGEGWTLALAGGTATAHGRCARRAGREVALEVKFDARGRPVSWVTLDAP